MAKGKKKSVNQPHVDALEPQFEQPAPEQPQQKLAKFSYAEALAKYEFEDKDLLYLGSPVMKDVKSRKYMESELERMADIKKRWKEKMAREEVAAEADTKRRETVAGEEFYRIGQNRERKEKSWTPGCDSLWVQILMLVCDDFEEDGVRGASVIARDLCNASCVSKELYIASIPAFQHLSTLCLPLQDCFWNLPPQGKRFRYYGYTLTQNHLWDSLISNPSALNHQDLYYLYADMGFDDTLPKERMVIKILERWGLKHPTGRPARAVFAVQYEKWHWSDNLHDLLNHVIDKKIIPPPDKSYVPCMEQELPMWQVPWRGLYHCYDVRMYCVNNGLPTLQALTNAACDDRWLVDNHTMTLLDTSVSYWMSPCWDSFAKEKKRNVSELLANRIALWLLNVRSVRRCVCTGVSCV